MRVPWEKLTVVRLHKNVASGGGAARGRQSTRAYCGSERIAEPRRRRIGAAGRAALAERMEWRGDGGRGVWGIFGRRAVESNLGGIFVWGGGGRIFAQWAGGVWRMVGFSKCSPTCQ